MKIRLRSRGLPPGTDFREFVQLRLGTALARFSPRIEDVSVRLEDENGPKGGVDKSCRISVDLGRLGTVMAEDVDAVLEAAICRAAECAGRSVARALERSGRGRRRFSREFLQQRT
ncbi:MAG: HPF/RaiA family ribosome-associated protein [Planctomycetes bacterium]|nr:HPF/RaiA family ribosome-associated protein [Planctomycetota bacterium]